jgi:hypothetical protein
MKKVMAVALVLMIFAFGVVAVHAQQTDTKDHGMMMSSNCPMTATAEGAKCGMCTACKCPMDAHHGSETSSAPEYFRGK